MRLLKPNHKALILTVNNEACSQANLLVGKSVKSNSRFELCVLFHCKFQECLDNDG